MTTRSRLLVTAQAMLLALMAASLDGSAEESPAVSKGPQFLLVLDEDQMLAAEQVLTNPWAVLPNDREMQNRARDMLAQLHSTKPVYWVVEDENAGWSVASLFNWFLGKRNLKLLKRWHIEWSLPRHILMGSASTRYHCRQTHGPGFIRWMDEQGQAQQIIGPDEYWGEDDGFDANENLNKFSPALCDYYDQRSKALGDKLLHAPGAFGGYPVVPPPWAWLFYATSAVQE